MNPQTQTWWAQEDTQKKRFQVPGSVYVLSFFVVLILIASVMASLIPDSSQPKRGPEQSLEYPVPVQDVLNGCGGIFHFDPIERNYGTIPAEIMDSEEPRVPIVPTRIQSYGYMDAEEWENGEKRFFESTDEEIPSLQRQLRAMWQGYYIMWYKPDSISPTDLSDMERLTENNSKVIVVPWNLGEDMPMKRNFSFATWNVSQSCAQWDSSTASAFTSLSDPVERDRNNPPEAPLSDENKLFNIPRFGYVPIEKPEEVPSVLQKDEYFYQ